MRVTAEPDAWGEMTSEAIQAACLASAPSNVLIRHPLFRRLYLVFFLLTTLLFFVPIWTIRYLPRANRPRSSWTLQRCLRVRWSRRICRVVASCEIDYLGRDLSRDLDPVTLTHSHPVTIPAAPSHLLRGHPAETLEQLHASRGSWNPHFVHRLHRKAGVWGAWNAEADRERVYGFEIVKAFWFTGKKVSPEEGPRPRQPGDPVMLHFHGGGYLCGTAAETDLTSSIAKSLAVHSPVQHILSVDYRLAPKAPWPLPLLDAISAYWYLLQEGIAESDIIVVGDSAGGHLGLALVRWLRDEGLGLGLKGPRGLVLMSPWCDVGFTNAWGEEGFNHNADSDTIDTTFGPFATSLLLRALPASLMHTSPYLSPASLLLPATTTGPASFESLPPTFIVYGGAERLARSIEILWDRIQLARKAEGKSGKLQPVLDEFVEGIDSVHDFMIFPWQAEEAGVVYEKLDIWLRTLLAAEEVASGSPVVSPRWDEMLSETRRRRVTMKIGRSPVMSPTETKRGVLKMVGEMSSEGISMIDMPPFDLDATERATKWLTPFTSQYERGDYDWVRDQGKEWYEIETSGSGSADASDEEDRKAR